MAQPPLDENARRLMKVVDGMPVRLPERERVVAALDMVATTEWTRVRVKLPQERIDALLRPRSAASGDLADLLAVARAAAHAYGFEHVGVGLIAVALVLTTRVGHTDAGDADVVAEAFGLGHLENVSGVLDRHRAAREAGRPAEDDGGPVGRLAWGPTAAGRRRQRLARAALYTTRGAAFVLLLVLAATGHGGLLAWPVAFAAILSSWDVRQQPLELADNLHVGELPLRRPWHGCLAAVAALAGLTDAAAVLTVLYLALPSIAQWGEAGEARHFCMEGAEVRGTGRRTATSQAVVESYAVRRRRRHEAVVLAVAAAPAALLAVAFDTPWVVCVLTAVFAARRLAGLAVVVAAVAVATGADVRVLAAVFAVGLVARAVDAWCDRPPLAHVPVRRPPLTWVFTPDGRSVAAAHRLLRRGLPAAALRRLATVPSDGRHPEARLLRGWAFLEQGHPGEAKRAVPPGDGVPAGVAALTPEDREPTGAAAPTPQGPEPTGAAAPTPQGPEPTGAAALITCLAELDLGDPEAAEAALARLDPDTAGSDHPGLSPSSGGRVERSDVCVARFRLALLRGDTDGLIETIAREVPTRITRRSLTRALGLLRLAAEAALPTRPSLALYLAGSGLVLARAAQPDSLSQDFGLAGTGRTVALEVVRCGALTGLAELREGVDADVDTVSQLGAADGAAGFLMRLDRPIEAAAHLNALADRLAADPAHRLAALDSRIEALTVLNATRHELHTKDERRQWWGVFGRTVHRAMEQAAAGADWETLAELVESARLQLGPDMPGGALDAAGTTAPFIRVRGVSRMEQAHWYRTGQSPPVHALEDMAGIVLGPGTWWWSTWVHDRTVFWSLVPPSGPVTGGTLALTDGTGLTQALSDLRDALPGRYPGEDDDAWEDRVLGSPLLTGPLPAELSLARRLGALLPPPLSRALLEGDGGMRLAIAPAAEFGHVPWPAVAVPDDRQDVAPGGPRDVRLVERCTAVVAPPAGLLARLADRPRPDDAPPLGLAVIDPGGDLPWVPEYARLPAARQLLGLVPDGVDTVGPATDLSLADFAERLRGAGSESTAVFACHVEADGEAPDRGILLRPGSGGAPPAEPPRVLTAQMLISAPDRYPMPRQVVLLACDSGDVGNASAGEWLVLGPALLWAGADRLVVTSYPVIDSVEEDPDTGAVTEGGDVIDGRLLSALVRRERVVDALHDVQREKLARWRATGREGAPIHWGGHLAMGAHGTPGTPRSLAPLPGRYVHETVLRLLDDAAEYAAGAGRATVTPRDVLVQLGLYGFETPNPLRRYAGLAPVYGHVLASAARQAVSRRRPMDDGRDVRPDDRVMDLLRATAAVANAARHQVVNVEHVLAALLGGRDVPASLGRAVFGWDGRRPEVVKEIVGDTQDGYQYTGLPDLHHLAADAVPELYAVLDADVPGPEDAERWHIADRKPR
ncbi:CHAT domain-containing protein [Streptomyces sp. NPDC026672]|uniref:CHAT domain-containing protein n=1 Tax=unclassified Streptomyces TaxID=2593676 RepID=UPI0033E2240E